MPSFRLDTEPWIPVVGTDGSSLEVSLTEVFSQLESLSRIVGSPLEAASILRLLLGIAHAATKPDNFEAWRFYWENRNEFACKCIAYIEEHAVWDLFDEDRPFVQDSRLREFVDGAIDKPIEPTFLNGSKLGTDAFISHASISSTAISASAAVRALLTTHSFSVGGTGTPNPLIPKRSGAYDKYSSSGLLAQSLVVIAEGQTLMQTILLNLLSNVNIGTPGWEFPLVVSNTGVPCDGIVDRFTRPAVCALLLPNSDGLVSRAIVTIGPKFDEGDVLDDPMIPRVRSNERFLQYKLDRSKALWRSAHVLLAVHERPLELIAHLRRLAERGILEGCAVSLRLLGICGEPGKVKHYLWRDELLPIGLSVLLDSSGGRKLLELERAVTTAEDKAAETRKRIYSFAARYLQDGSDVAPDKREIGRLADELSPDLNDYWSMLGPAGERIACDDFDENAWHDLIKRASEVAFQKAVDRLPPDARRFRAQFSRHTKETSRK